MTTLRFPIRVGRRSRLLLRVAFGVTPDSAWAELTDDAFVARFGRFHARAPLADVASWRIEGPFRWITAIGVRRSVRHGDVSFAGSPHGGVRLDFREPVRMGWFSVPAFYVGADDLEGFAAAVAARGIPGEDRRRR
jgi:hypothetical protein